VAALRLTPRIAANLVLGVTEPMMNGIGGDLFLIYWEAKTGKLYGLNASGWVPRNLTVEFLAKNGITTMPRQGIHSVTVPGAVDGWKKPTSASGGCHGKICLAPRFTTRSTGIQFQKSFKPIGLRKRQSQRQSGEPARLLPGGKVPELGAMFGILISPRHSG